MFGLDSLVHLLESTLRSLRKDGLSREVFLDNVRNLADQIDNYDEPSYIDFSNDLLHRFEFESLDLIDESGGLSVDPWLDGHNRIRISISYPSGTKDPGLKKRWKNLITKWLTRAAQFNERNHRREEDYPPPLQKWLALRERLEQFKQLDPAKHTEWMKEEIKESLFEDGYSYQDLADSMNQWIGQTTTEFLMSEAFNTAQRDPYPKLKYEAIRDAMTFFNVPVNKQDEFFEEARRRRSLRECVVPILHHERRKLRKPRPDGPITRKQVEAKVRQMRKSGLTCPS